MDQEALSRRVAELEAANRALEQELRPFIVLADNIPDNIYFKDREGKFLWVNRNLYKNRGMESREALIGKTSEAIHGPDRAKQSMEDDRKVIDTGEYLLNKLETDHDAAGKPMWVLTTKIPLRDASGSIIGLCGISKDVTAQINAEQILARESGLRNDLLENLPDSVYFKDEKSRFTWVNKAVVDTLGMRSKEDVLGRTDADFFSMDHALDAREDEERIMETGIPSVNKLEMDNFPDGSPRWVITTKIPLHDGKGKVIGTCGVTKDITALKKAEDALARESALMNDLLDNVPDIIYFKDKDSRFTWVNRVMVGLLGAKTKEEIFGKSDADYFTPEHAREAREDELRVMMTGEPIINKLERDNYADGSPRWVYTIKMPLHDTKGNIVGSCGITRDISALKKAEEALALESNLLQALMENIPDAIYFKDADSKFVRVSKNCHLEGMKGPEDAIGKTDFDFFAREHAQDSFDDEQRIIKTGVPLIDKVEKEVFDTDRPDSWVSTTKVPIYDKAGKVSGLVGISRDVTERARAEEAIRKAKEELEVRVAERTSALVQEIKEHLKTEKALRDGERKLQESNIRLESRVSQLNFLNAAAGRLTHFTHRRELLPSIVETFTQVFAGLEAAILEMGPQGYTCAAASKGLSNPALREACEKALAPQRQAHLVQAILAVDRTKDPALSIVDFPGLAHLTAIAALPLVLEDRPLAVVVLLAPPAFVGWYDQERALVATLASQVAVSLSNANNFEELGKKARLEGELEVAQTIQRRFTPQGKPPIPRINLKGVYHPAYEVGGDYLDYFQTDSGSWVVVIADVSGKGIPAALVMTMLRSTFRAEARYENSAKKLMCAVNDLMLADLDDKSFVTALCLIIDKDGKSMSYARAGHPPLLVTYGNNGNQPMPLNPKGLALGMVGGKDFSDRMEEQVIALGAGDRYLIFTDGLLEAMDSERKFYGIKRLLGLLAADRSPDPDAILTRILDDVRVFIRSEPYHDDLTMLAMEVTG